MYFVCLSGEGGGGVHVAVGGQLSGVGSLLHLVEGLMFSLLHELPSNSPLSAPHLITGTLGLQRHASASGFPLEFWQLNKFSGWNSKCFHPINHFAAAVCARVLPLLSSALFILHMNLCSEHSCMHVHMCECAYVFMCGSLSLMQCFSWSLFTLQSLGLFLNLGLTFTVSVATQPPRTPLSLTAKHWN